MAPLPPLCFVTTNAGKLREAEALLGRAVEGVALDLAEIQAADLETVVRHKTAAAFGHLRRPLLVEDTALGFAAWGGLPGPFIRFFLERMGPEKLAAAVAVAAGAEPGAEARSGIGYHDGERVHYFQGSVAGTIVAPRGQGGFGWDAIFQPRGAARTFAEMGPDEKNAHSMRGKAFAALQAFLEGRAP